MGGGSKFSPDTLAAAAAAAGGGRCVCVCVCVCVCFVGPVPAVPAKKKEAYLLQGMGACEKG